MEPCFLASRTDLRYLRTTLRRTVVSFMALLELHFKMELVIEDLTVVEDFEATEALGSLL